MNLPACTQAVYCTCGDQLIHQNKRGHNESSSLLGQHVHDSYPPKFDWIDVDGLIWKASRRRLIFIEHKYPGQIVSPAQKRILPVLGNLVKLGVEHGLIESGGAVLLYGTPPFANACATFYPQNRTIDLDRDQLDALLQGNTITLKRAA